MEEISKLINSGQLDEAVSWLKEIIANNAQDDNAWFLIGKAYWRMGRHAEAISAYQHAVALNPESPASIALDMAGDVMDFFNPDLLNP